MSPLSVFRTDEYTSQFCRRQRIENVLHAGVKEVRKNSLEHAHNSGSYKVPFVGRNAPEKVEPDWMFNVGRIEICHIFDASTWDMVKNIGR